MTLRTFLKTEDIESSEHSIADETLRDIYLEAMNKISDSYIKGTIKYIQEHYKDLDNEINKTNKRLNEVWKECNEGKASLDDFRDVLNLYQKLYLEAIELYKSKIENEQTAVAK